VIFELIKFMCFDSTLILPLKVFLIPRPPLTHNKFNPQLPCTQSSVGPTPAPQMRVPATHADLPARAGLYYTIQWRI